MIRPTIRDGLWFAALLLMALCWLLDHENLSHDQSEKLASAKAAWAEAAKKDHDETLEKVNYIMRRMAEKFPDQPEPAQ